VTGLVRIIVALTMFAMQTAWAPDNNSEAAAEALAL
jgi:hypothetical protein